LPYQRREVIDGVPSGIGKIDEWLVAALAVELQRKKKKRWWQGEGKWKSGK
jgi:hypothetical protein